MMEGGTMDESLFGRRRILTLKRGKERAVAHRHPWIFAGAIHSEKGPEDAPFADLVDSDGVGLASGFYSQPSQIRLRALTFGEEELSADLFVARITGAVERRRSLFDEGTNACRLIHSEGDGLSGIVVDRYDDVLVVEIANRGAEQVKPLLANLSQHLTVAALIEGQAGGKIDVDDAAHPQAALVQCGHRYYLVGDPNNADFNAGVKTWLDDQASPDAVLVLYYDETDAGRAGLV
jgi:23S rRNA G2069 N7-methylase RlmK/C1962 C5-methylase RlmI